MSAGRGHDGLLALEKLATDHDPEFRAKLAFDLSIGHEPAAIGDLIRMAKSDLDTHVREQAILWLAQQAGNKAIATLKDAVENDLDLAVKKKAGFAISQLPKDEAVPELLHVAQTNSDAAVRKEAIFWLGQSRDPRRPRISNRSSKSERGDSSRPSSHSACCLNCAQHDELNGSIRPELSPWSDSEVFSSDSQSG